jgi:hypothetical protein
MPGENYPGLNDRDNTLKGTGDFPLKTAVGKKKSGEQIAAH